MLRELSAYSPTSSAKNWPTCSVPTRHHECPRGDRGVRRRRLPVPVELVGEHRAPISPEQMDRIFQTLANPGHSRGNHTTDRSA